MKEKYIVDKAKFLTSLLTVVCCLIIAGTLAYMGRYGSTAVFVIIAAAYGFIAYIYGRCVVMDDDGIGFSFLGHKGLTIKWSEAAEIGIAGTKIFKKKESKKAGTLYIYVSKKKMTDDERFNMMLHWPPKDKVYMVFNQKRAETLQMHWSGKFTLYNEGNTKLEFSGGKFLK
jgi:hypothetical protein